MAKINGSLVLVYADGTLVASQKGCTVTWEQDLPEASSKDSTGWEEHINGTRRATVDFDALYNTSGLSAEELITYITSRASLVLVIDGTGVPIVGEAKVQNITINAAQEEAVTFSGAFKFTGPAWMLTGAYANLLTDPDGTSSDYDTMTVSGISITSAINASGTVNVLSSALTGGVAEATYKVITFLTLNSGEAPGVLIRNLSGGAAISNTVTLAAGVNVATLNCTTVADGGLCFINTAATNWSTSNIYCFKV